MTSELVVIVPTLARPQALRPLAESFAETTTTTFRILFIVDPDDAPTWRAFESLEHEFPEIDALAFAGNYVQKTNIGIRSTTEPLLLPGADDIRPHAGWLEAAKAHMTDEIGFVSLNDLGNHDVMAGTYATLPLVARWYVDLLDDDLYHAGYHHNAVDVDASLTARARGAFAYAPDALMEHLHPAWEKAEVDGTHRRGGMNEERARTDHELLDRRWPGWRDTI